MGQKVKKSSKKGPGEKERYTVQSSLRRSLYLLKYPINELPVNQLPSVRNILQYFHFLQSSRSTRFQSSKETIACPTKTGTRSLVFQYRACERLINRCVTSTVTDIWIKAGFTSNSGRENNKSIISDLLVKGS
ncbi:uncharacterized protein LOC136087458 isoform X2 [Hydra vulgaris]|uniref:Uncharacterized protein LOC136087458 isoform X2 n=1 Tax=Hydra vulgaris TaxID=6087 RepID=A0ABM4CWK6_HYDVU